MRESQRVNLYGQPRFSFWDSQRRFLQLSQLAQEPNTVGCYWVADIGGTNIRAATVSEKGDVIDVNRSATSQADWKAAWNDGKRGACVGAVMAVAARLSMER